MTKASIFCQSHEYQVLSRRKFASLGLKMLEELLIVSQQSNIGTTLKDV
jgi:hypothetical protein